MEKTVIDPQEETVHLFVSFIFARFRGDDVARDLAVQALADLGIEVKFKRRIVDDRIVNKK